MKTTEEIEKFIDRTGAYLGIDKTCKPVFPENRTDICAVRRISETGKGFGFDTIYVVWEDKEGNLWNKEILNSRKTKDNILVKSSRIEKEKLVVELEIKRTLLIPIQILN